MKNLFLENSLHYYKNGKSKMIKPLGIFRFQGVLSAYYTIPKINRELQHGNVEKACKGNYTIPKINRELQPSQCLRHVFLDYTIRKINRELQLSVSLQRTSLHYTIPKINRELQHQPEWHPAIFDYTIPKINRELQPFIRCQGGKEGLKFDLKKNVFLWEQILKKVLTNSF